MTGIGGGRWGVRLVGGVAVAGVLVAGLVVAPGQAEAVTLAAAVPAVAAAAAVPSRTVARKAARSGVRVRGVKVARAGRLVSARIEWNQAMIAREGHHHRFNTRLVAFGPGGLPVVLASRSATKRPPRVEQMTIGLGGAKAKQLRAATDAVLSVSQQYGRKGTHGNKFFRNFVTVTNLKLRSRDALGRARSAAVGGSVSRAGRDCRTTEIRPGADLSGCDWSGVNLSVCDLTGVNLTGAVLSGALLRNCGLAGVELAGADLTGVKITGVTGTPASLPDGWAMDGGRLTRPSTPVSCATGGACVVGDTGPGGGVVFYVAGSPQSWGTYLEAAPAGWSGGGVDPLLVWGVGSTAGECGNLSIATATGIGAGATNTTAITTTPACDDSTKAPAAWAAKDYTGGGQSDWFLPSKDELNQLCKYARGQDTSQANQAVVCDSTGSLLPGFTASYYWSSSQFNATVAWAQFFVSGNQHNVAKNYTSRVRPVRAF